MKRRNCFRLLIACLLLAGSESRAQNSKEAEDALTDTSGKSKLASISNVGTFEWGALAPGAIVFSDSDRYQWESVPADLHGIRVQKHPKHLGVLEFSAASDGFAYIVTTDRWDDSGNSSGDWLDEVMYEKDLRRAGWRKLRAIKNLSTSGSGEMHVFWRYCRAGENHKIRTEKYIAPMLLRR